MSMSQYLEFWAKSEMCTFCSCFVFDKVIRGSVWFAMFVLVSVVQQAGFWSSMMGRDIELSKKQNEKNHCP